MDLDYKKAKENFNTNTNGTTAQEVGLVLSLSLWSSVLSQLLFAGAGVGGPVIETIGIVYPILASFIFFDGKIVTLHCLLALTCSVLWVVAIVRRPAESTVKEKNVSIQPNLYRRPSYITNYRGYVYIGTVITILAVDFHIFPRRYAKTETYGKGLMDVGVGMFVLISALVSAEARGIYQREKRTLLLRLLRSTAPLILLGIVRLLSVKSVNYQEHVSEYGVHWNFFFTLAALKIVSTLVNCFIDVKYCFITASILGFGYQYALNNGISSIVLHGTDGLDSREGLFNANREGIFSTFGYVSLYFYGVALGKLLMKASEASKPKKALLLLIAVSLTSYMGMYFLETSVEQVSRRLCNLPFVFWMIGLATQNLALQLLVDLATIRFFGHLREIRLLNAINQHGLLLFLASNLLTGAINLSINTLDVSDNVAHVILVVYMGVVCALASIFYSGAGKTKSS